MNVCAVSLAISGFWRNERDKISAALALCVRKTSKKCTVILSLHRVRAICTIQKHLPLVKPLIFAGKCSRTLKGQRQCLVCTQNKSCSVLTNRLKVYMNYERTPGYQIDLFVYLKVPPNFCEASPVSEARCGTFSDACQNLNVSDGFHVKASRDARRKFQLALVINLCFVSHFYHPLPLCSTPPVPPPLFPPLLALQWLTASTRNM